MEGDRSNQVAVFARSSAHRHTTYLIRKSASTEITERKLEFTIAALYVDLEGDKSVGICGRSRRHGNNLRL
jgi:hypothetical protein